ncbi:MAG: fumarylacetoacetate hydrolase family protein [Halanaerobiales bacterium]|nr:fumarylacetoacetate hydrolase family protein [Halanaerobiales bacterium]
MKIVRFKKDNNIYYGRLEDDRINKVEGDIFNNYKITSEYMNKNSVSLLPPVSPSNIIGIGLNYKRHALESNKSFPEKPIIFLKATTSILGHKKNIKLPNVAPNWVDFEGELAIIIGKEAKNIKVKNVKDYVLGYTCANDVSARDCQFELDNQWARAKSFDTFCPIGPWIETELNNPDNSNITTKLNGEIMQDSNTSNLIFNTKKLVSYCSRNFTLKPGTIILTGTPDGVGFARDPQVFLKKDDKIEIEIEGIGRLVNKVIN